jgi:hypothetical protein
MALARLVRLTCAVALAGFVLPMRQGLTCREGGLTDTVKTLREASTISRRTTRQHVCLFRQLSLLELLPNTGKLSNAMLTQSGHTRLFLCHLIAAALVQSILAC